MHLLNVTGVKYKQKKEQQEEISFGGISFECHYSIHLNHKIECHCSLSQSYLVQRHIDAIKLTNVQLFYFKCISFKKIQFWRKQINI